jgi:hypothetical protein
LALDTSSLLSYPLALGTSLLFTRLSMIDHNNNYARKEQFNNNCYCSIGMFVSMCHVDILQGISKILRLRKKRKERKAILHMPSLHT